MGRLRSRYDHRQMSRKTQTRGEIAWDFHELSSQDLIVSLQERGRVRTSCRKCMKDLKNPLQKGRMAGPQWEGKFGRAPHRMIRMDPELETSERHRLFAGTKMTAVAEAGSCRRHPHCAICLAPTLRRSGDVMQVFRSESDSYKDMLCMFDVLCWVAC